MNLGDLSESWNPAIDQYRSEAQSGSAQKNFENYNQDAPVARGLLKDPGTFDQGLAFKNPAADAIKSKYTQDFKVKEDALALRLRKMGEDDHLRKLEVAGQIANEEIALNAQKRALKDKMKRAKKAARGQLIGSVLGIAGGVAGAYLGAAGGPTGMAMGAQAGMALGSGVGGAAGSM